MEKINVTNKHIKSTEFYRKMFFVLASILSLTLPLVSIIISANIIVSLKNITDFFFFLVIVFLSVVISFVSITFIFKINIYKCNREDIKFLLFYFTGHSFLIAVSILYLYSVLFRLDNVLIDASINFLKILNTEVTLGIIKIIIVIILSASSVYLFSKINIFKFSNNKMESLKQAVLYFIIFILLINLSIIHYIAYLILPYALIILPLFSAKLLFIKNKTEYLIKNRIEKLGK